MTQPIGPRPNFNKDPEPPKVSFLRDFFRDFASQCEKATTPCDTYCDKQWKEQLSGNHDQFIKNCTKDCRDFQNRLP